MRAPVLLSAVLILAAPAAHPAGAQDLAGLTRAETVDAPMPQADPGAGRPITLELREATLEQALVALGRAARLEISYTDAVTRSTRKVTVALRQVSLEQAIDAVLRGTELEAIQSADGRTLMVRERRAAAADSGAINGVVTDAKTGQALPGAEVLLEGTRWRTTTADDGRYRLAEVGAGSYTLVVRRIGYTKRSQQVTVTSEQETTVDLALEPVPTQLNEIVTTATGEQRLRELGHVVGRINADSLVREAPVTNLSELLTSRVPGLQVQQPHGAVGGRVKVQVRGPNSISLNNQPIVIVDGVRYTNEERPVLFPFGGPGDVEPSSSLNDININDIESIEVVKGPSAATLYGTDAANGVIVVTTKRGLPGPARWQAYAKSTTTAIPTDHFPDIYWGWGTVDGVPNNSSVSCTLARQVSGECTQQDSITVLTNPLNDPRYSILGSQPTWEYGASVAGGRQDLRYHFSADYQDATGSIRMPPAIAEQLQQQRGLGELPVEWREPNAFTKLNLRSNITAMLGEGADLRVTAGYIRNDSRTLPKLFNPYLTSFSRPTPDAPYGSDPLDSPEIYAQTTSERTDRFLSSASGRWRPAPWLETRATLGLDLSNGNRYGLIRPGDQPNGFFPDGAVEDSRSRELATTAELGATATARRGRLSARTAVGGQYVRTLSSASGSYGERLAPGGSVPQSALTISTRQTHSETVVLGGYLEEMLGLNDRLFLTGALRLDGASTFGRNFDAAVYPKMGASWLLSEEPFLPRVPGLEELRLRYAFGVSGKQPDPASARPRFGPDRMWLNDEVVNQVILTDLGNSELGPERVREHEFGFDMSLLASRLTLEATWFRRRTTGMLAFEPGPVGIGVIQTNLGLVTQRGFEAQVHARVLDTRLLSWDLALQHANYTTRLVDVGNGFMQRADFGGYVEGYPLGARFVRPVLGWEDVNGDGIIDFSEIQTGDSAVYMGESIPPRSQTLTMVLGFFEGRLRLSGLLERKTGFSQVNVPQCFSTCRAAVDRNAPFGDQVKAVRSSFVVPEKGDFTRLREVTAALELPAAWSRAVRFRSATLSFSARNLVLWTDFSGPDPEAGDPTLSAALGTVAGGSAQGIPHSRTFSVRLDLGL